MALCRSAPFLRSLGEEFDRYLSNSDNFLLRIRPPYGFADRLAFMGVKMDHARNALRGDGAWCLSAKDSKVKIFVIPTDEEFMIASDVERIVNGK